MMDVHALIRSFCEQCFVLRAPEGALSLFSDGAQVFGLRGEGDLLSRLRAMLGDLPACGALDISDARRVTLAPGLTQGYARVALSFGADSAHVDVTGVSRAEDGGEKLVTLTLTRREGTETLADSLVHNVSCGMAICRVNAAGALAIEYLNDGYFTMLEETRESLAARYREDIMAGIHEDDRAMVARNLRDLAENRRGHEMTYRFTTSGGAEKWIYVKTVAVNQLGGETVSYSTYTDLTEHMQIRRQLAEVIDTVPCGICLYRWAQGQFTPLLANAQLASLLGIDLDAFMTRGESARLSRVHPDDREAFVRERNAGLTRDGRYDCVYRCRNDREGTQFWVRERGATSRQPDGSRLVYVSYAVEESIKNRLLADALEAANAASHAKSQFLSRMSHELRTPMNAIIGLSSLEGGEGEDLPALRDAVTKIGVSARYLMSLIDDILDMSRIESGRQSLREAPFDFSRLLASVSDAVFKQATAKGLAYEAVVSGQTDNSYIGDKHKLSQVLLNVLGNAVKFTPPGGRVTLTVQQIRRVKRRATLRFEIADTGVGIDGKFLPRLFDAFSQEAVGFTSTATGTGLGLAIAKGLVEMMHGEISAQSVKNVGSVVTFEVQLGVVKENCERAARDAQGKCARDFTGKRVLMTDDHPLNVEVARRILERAGLEVSVATNGLEALEIFSTSPVGYFDAVLMDIRMPVMDGLTAAKRMRALQREDAASVPIIAISANASDEDAALSLAHGMNAHLTKPIDPPALYAALAQYML